MSSVIYDFDRNLDRSDTNAVAVDGWADFLLGGEPLPWTAGAIEPLMSGWVADMQFASAPPAIAAIEERLRHPILGYTANLDDQLYEAVTTWTRARHGWTFARDELLVSTGVVPALYDLVEYGCRPDDRVLTLTPSYKLFEQISRHRRRDLVTSALVERSGRYSIDFDDLAEKATDPTVGIFLFCHPHNPTGRAWTESELRRVGEICLDHDVRIVSDEVFCDLLRSGGVHTPLAKLFPDRREIVTCMAPSKTFNLAGMMTAMVVMPDPDLRAVWEEYHYPLVSPLGLAAAIGAYNHGGEWLDQLRRYLDDNLALVDSFLAAELPRARFSIPDATYLAWIDVGAYFPPQTDLTKHFYAKAGVLLEGGDQFVDNATGWVRLNVACPRVQLEAMLERIRDATVA